MKPNAFRVWLDSGDTMQSKVWRAMGATPSMISNWANGRGRPGLAHAIAIERLSGGAVPVESWLLPEEERSALLEPLEAR